MGGLPHFQGTLPPHSGTQTPVAADTRACSQVTLVPRQLLIFCPQNIHAHLPPVSVTWNTQSQAADPISSRISPPPAAFTSWALR